MTNKYNGNKYSHDPCDMYYGVTQARRDSKNPDRKYKAKDPGTFHPTVEEAARAADRYLDEAGVHKMFRNFRADGTRNAPEIIQDMRIQTQKPVWKFSNRTKKVTPMDIPALRNKPHYNPTNPPEFYGVKYKARTKKRAKWDGRVEKYFIGSFENQIDAAKAVDSCLDDYGIDPQWRNFKPDGERADPQTMYIMHKGMWYFLCEQGVFNMPSSAAPVETTSTAKASTKSKQRRGKAESGSINTNGSSPRVNGEPRVKVEKFGSITPPGTGNMPSKKPPGSPPSSGDGKEKAQPQKEVELFCICSRPEFGYMYQCPTCSFWYHNSCMNVDDKILDTLESENRAPPCAKCNPTSVPNIDSHRKRMTSQALANTSLPAATATLSWRKRGRGDAFLQPQKATEMPAKRPKLERRSASPGGTRAPLSGSMGSKVWLVGDAAAKDLASQTREDLENSILDLRERMADADSDRKDLQLAHNENERLKREVEKLCGEKNEITVRITSVLLGLQQARKISAEEFSCALDRALTPKGGQGIGWPGL